MDKPVFVRSRGNNRWDQDCNKYLDFTSGGIFAAVFGSNNLTIKQALSHASSICCYGAAYDSPESLRLKDMLKEMTGYESVVLYTTGSEATEAFWRVCRIYTGKPGVWGGLVNPDECGQDNPLPDAMHGMTLGSLIMAGKMRLPHPGMFKELGADYEGVSFDGAGCAIFEPYHAASAQFHREHPTMERIRGLMNTFPDIHFCCDEIQGGMGRTGKLFAHQWYSPEVKPEFVVVGKALGGGLPLSALLGPKDILEDASTLEHAHLHSTHSGNPVCCAAGIEVLERIQKENLIDEVHRKGLVLADALKDCGVRVHAGKGLLAGLEMEGPLMTKQVVETCRKMGLLVIDTGRKWVKLGPAYNITDTEIFEGCSKLKAAIQEVQRAITEACREEGKEPEPGDEDIPGDGVQAGGQAGEGGGPEDDGQPGPPV